MCYIFVKISLRIRKYKICKIRESEKLAPKNSYIYITNMKLIETLADGFQLHFNVTKFTTFIMQQSLSKETVLGLVDVPIG